MMLRSQWNASRVGDRVPAPDELVPGLPAHEGTVRVVETRAEGANDVDTRMETTGEPGMPRRRALHMLPLDRRFVWRYDTIATLGQPNELGAVAA